MSWVQIGELGVHDQDSACRSSLGLVRVLLGAGLPIAELGFGEEFAIPFPAAFVSLPSAGSAVVDHDVAQAVVSRVGHQVI